MSSIGRPPRNISPELQRYLEKFRETLEKGEGQRPKQLPADRYVKFKDLVDAKILRPSNGVGAGGGGPVFWMPGDAVGGGPPNMAVPPPPSGLAAHAGFKTVTLIWDDPHEAYSNHGLTEILRANVDDSGQATVVGRSETFMWADTTVEHGLTYYYWIRFVSATDVQGPINGVNGAKAVPAKIKTVDITENAITTPLLAAGAITADKAVIANAAIFEAMIADAQIGTAKIRNASITTAKIQFAAITSALIATASITTAHIRDAAVNTLKIQGHAVTVPATTTWGSVSVPRGGSATIGSTPTFNCAGGGFTALFTCNMTSPDDAYGWFFIHVNGGNASGEQRCGIRGEGSANVNFWLPVCIAYHHPGPLGNVSITVTVRHYEHDGFTIYTPRLTFLGVKR